MRRALSLAVLVALTIASPVWAQGDPVETYLRQLNNADNNDRIAAMAKLGEMGPKAAKAVPALLKIFAFKNEDLRLNAALALGKIGKPAVPGLVETLKQTDGDVRYYALSALGWIGPAAKGAAPAVIDAFADQRPEVRRKAAFALGAITPEPKAAVKELVRLLNDSNTEVRLAAGDALARFGAAAVPELVPLLRGGRQTAFEAAKALGKIGPEAKPAIPLLKDWLSFGDSTSPQIAAETLSQIGKDAVPVLSDALKGKGGVVNPSTQRVLVAALGKLGADGAPALIDALGSDHAEVRQLAALQLGTLKIGDKMVVLALAHLLKDVNDPVKLAAARALQQIGPQAKPAAPALLAAVRDANPQVRQSALFALRVVGGEPAIMLPALKELIKDADPVIRRQVIPLLTGQGSAAVPLVMEALRDMDPTVRSQALSTLQSLQGDLKAALPALKELSKDPAVTVRRAAVLVLGRTEADAVPVLLDAYNDQDATVRRNVLMAFRTLGPAAAKATPKLKEILEKEPVIANRRLLVVAMLNIDDEAAKAGLDHVRKENDAVLWNQAAQNAGPGVISAKVTVPFLIDALKNVQPAVRTQVVNQLANHGPAARDALPALRGLATDTNPTLRNAVEAAIKRIDPQ